MTHINAIIELRMYRDAGWIRLLTLAEMDRWRAVSSVVHS